MTDQKFSPGAAIRWAAIGVESQRLILSKVYCSYCRKAVQMVDFGGSEIGNDLLLKGHGAVCGHEVARVVEGT
jgi:hypothetical protein